MSLSPNNRANVGKTDTRHQHILLTGASGFVGAHLLQQLLAQTTADIICIVNAETEAAALTRIAQALAQQQLACADFTRVSIVLADLEKPALGLSPAMFNTLAQKVDAIIHNAAITSVMRDYQSLRAANVLSTGELLRMAAIKAIPFHLISTIAVAPPRSVAATLDEDFVPIHSGLLDGYQQSKWVAEQFAAIAQQKGYPINLYRLARVVGAAGSGYINPKDLVWSLIQTGLRYDALPHLPISEPWTPVDKVAQFIVSDALVNPGQGVCNITPTENVRLAQIYEWLKRYGFRFSILGLDAWCARIERDSQLTGAWQDQALPAFFAQRKNLAAADGVFETARVSNRKFTQKALAVKLRLPAIDRPLFNTYLRYAMQAQLISPPEICATVMNKSPTPKSAEVIDHE